MSGRPILTAAETKAAEEAVFARGVSVFGLMTKAGRAAAEIAWDRFGPRETLVLCGPGNNGGDGYVIAARLRECGVRVRVAASGDPTTDAAREARRAWGGPVEVLDEAAPAPLVIDALFGTGLSRPLKNKIAEPASRLLAAAAYRVAVDLPSGIATDDGAVLTELPPAHLTVALGALKRAHRLMPAAARCGEVVVADIGLGDPPRGVIEIGRPPIAAPGFEANKYTRGKVVVAAGRMPGATMLASLAAQRAGAGYVELLGAEGEGVPHALVRRAWDDEALADKRIGAMVIGPGLGTEGEGRRRLDLALATDHPLVLDADALTLLARDGLDRLPARKALAVLTPHGGEYARLFPDAGGTALDKALVGARKTGAVILLKGVCTVVAHPDGRAAIGAPAPAWLASAGTGDVLAGILGTMLAQMDDPFEAAQAAVWLHSEAGRRAGPLLIADDLVEHLRGAVAGCLA
ncbi:NAD(P)H-hydrate dehydratase [Sphingomonas sp. CGMCC 1.13654]|uniref:Bifunctional NAD(P)H-hydrate repair enzyme n=1 Tax=Sphingomonas chungangi TaxID=2683589 RepID=A0A838LFZ3_9SPHN|nr:NAD(P)H-hydrate dehydratase [Sphingomonas chungangi]MBA2936348.1 NAD(P)H-hydrate dehydratase [Sphingomonas chungangi]MVW55733.1 NAD(P)H-hydrate dehydratase [Sphingomonas chungangi]